MFPRARDNEAAIEDIFNQTVSNDPDAPAPLTPSVLLTPRDESDVVTEQIDCMDLLKLRRVQYLDQQFWTRKRDKHLHNLNVCHKWKVKRTCIQVRDAVLIRDKQVPRNRWPLGRVTEVKPSRDGLVRSVELRLSSKTKDAPKTLTRPISELILLVPGSHHSCKDDEEKEIPSGDRIAAGV